MPLPVLYGTGIAIALLAAMQCVGALIWCFKIAQARGKSPLVGLMLLLPGINVLALAYLALSGCGSSKAPPVETKPGLRLAI